MKPTVIGWVLWRQTEMEFGVQGFIRGQSNGKDTLLSRRRRGIVVQVWQSSSPTGRELWSKKSPSASCLDLKWLASLTLSPDACHRGKGVTYSEVALHSWGRPERSWQLEAVDSLRSPQLAASPFWKGHARASPCPRHSPGGESLSAKGETGANLLTNPELRDRKRNLISCLSLQTQLQLKPETLLPFLVTWVIKYPFLS